MNSARSNQRFPEKLTVKDAVSQQKLLEVRDLRVYFKSVLGDYKVVDGCSFTVGSGEIFGLAGESGCGKSTLVEGVLRLIRPPGRIESGQVLLKVQTGEISADSIDLLALDPGELRDLRWKHVSYIPQGSMNSLNPVMRIRDQMVDAMLDHGDIPKGEATGRAIELLAAVGLQSSVTRKYPHELSGGMKQRVIIANAMSLGARLVVADEPTTALDVTNQRLALQAIRALRDRFNSSVILVSHDMEVHAEIADRLAIMYAGKIVEIGTVYDVFEKPLHPYSRALINSIPSLQKERRRIEPIVGVAPSPLSWPAGCRFHDRCPYVMPICEKEEPVLLEVEPDHWVACYLYPEAR